MTKRLQGMNEMNDAFEAMMTHEHTGTHDDVLPILKGDGYYDDGLNENETEFGSEPMKRKGRMSMKNARFGFLRLCARSSQPSLRMARVP